MKKKKKILVTSGIAHIHTTMNNIIITITDLSGNALLQESSGTLGYKGTKKSSPYVSNLVAAKIGKDAISLGVKNLNIKIKGIGRGKAIALRTLLGLGFVVEDIADITPLPHNGCTPQKKPR